MAKVLAPLTVRLLNVAVLFVMLGFVPLINKEPTVTPVCRSTVALVIVNELVVLPILPEPLTTQVPALTVVPPLYVFAPDNVHVPVSCLTSVPAPVPMTLAILPPLAPPKVKLKPAPVSVPVLESAILPALPMIEAFEPKLTRPA